MSADGSGWLSSLTHEVMMDWHSRSKALVYRNDPEAWLSDILGVRWHAKQREIGEAFLTSDRVAVKSANGSGKSRMVAELTSWGICTHGLGELLCIITAPTLRQVEKVVFEYLKQNYSNARARNHPMPGQIADSLEWIYRENPRDPKRTLVLGMKPADKDVVSTFQGIRSIGLESTETWVMMDEAGGVPQGLFTAAEAVTTGSKGKIVAIGNPDNLNTEFHKLFTDPKMAEDWSLHTISAFDLPTITGEIVYPNEPEKQAAMLNSGMNDLAWVERNGRAWGVDSARYLSKVLGQFPDSDDRSFFPQSAVDTAAETDIPIDFQVDLHGGLDLARFGEDDSMLYGNRGGRIRKVASWSKATANESATRADSLAREHAMTMLVIDAAGLGGPIMDQIVARAGNAYTVLRALGAERSPDPTRWLNARAYWFDMFREAMMAGRVDLDFDEDPQLREELLMIQYDFTPKGAIKIESKKDMAARGVKSPDALDAVIYSFMKEAGILDGPITGLQKGDVVMFDPWTILGADMAGLPI